MAIRELLSELSERVGVNASAARVYGEAVTVGQRTVIPVARIGYGFGAGMGPSDSGGEKGGGGGGGLGAAPAGLVEITPEGVQYIEFGLGSKLGAAILCGFLGGLLFGRLLSRR